MAANPPPPNDLLRELEETVERAVRVHAVSIARLQADLAPASRLDRADEVLHAMREFPQLLAEVNLESICAVGRSQEATHDFDDAFDRMMACVGTMRKRAGQATLASIGRAERLSPLLAQLREELASLHPQVIRCKVLLKLITEALGRSPQEGEASEALDRAHSLAHRTRSIEDLHWCGRRVVEGLGNAEQAFAAMLMRLKRELAPTFVEWKRVLAPVAMRAGFAIQREVPLSHAQNIHDRLQQQAMEAAGAAVRFETAERRLLEDCVALGRLATSLAEASRATGTHETTVPLSIRREA